MSDAPALEVATWSAGSGTTTTVDLRGLRGAPGATPLAQKARVLDFGCGFGFAPRLLRSILVPTMIGDVRRGRRHRAFARTQPRPHLVPQTLAAMTTSTGLGVTLLAANFTYHPTRFTVVLDKEA